LNDAPIAADLAMFDALSRAALAQVCHDFGVPFGVVRAVSDRADDEAHVDANSFVAEVAS
jgi:nucleoside phosphorylase